MMQMEKLLNHCDMELMKMAMLKHEETFQQQFSLEIFPNFAQRIGKKVHELHRLYRVQKQLMSGLTTVPSCRRQMRRKHPRRALDLHLPADEYIVVGAGGAAPPSREDDLELTLAVGGGGRRKRRDENATATPLASSNCSSGAGSPTSSSSTDTSGSPYQRAMALRLLQQQQQQQQAPWLVQCLSLRMA
ncbi:hypothetical protein EJB05_05729 [Eragrostis curvula]|uniref:Uncharacterized protein n=1 Tax=Eragrostis curvula TaxID=38414 RepID=A0A5J9WCX9_9POAL|nr:hypothetical protein EJB05_05729 [Eragrostis curvula]